MRKLAGIIFLFFGFVSQAQFGFEEYYPEKDLQAILRKAKSNWDLVEANGMLALHYKATLKDSLSLVYLEKTKQIASTSTDPKLKARGLWWDNKYEEDTLKAGRLLEFATRNNLAEEKIVANVELTRINIHINLTVAEQNAMAAWKLWGEWKRDSVRKDSLKLEVLKQMAHVHIHKRDGVKALTFLLPLQDYAAQDRNLDLKELALNGMSDMYYEWPGQFKKATDWMVKLYEHYKKTGQPNKLLYAAYGLASQYSNTGEKEKARVYFNEMEQLSDSIAVYGYDMEYGYYSRYSVGLITTEEYARLIESDYNHKYVLPPLKKTAAKINLYIAAKKYDSVKPYLDLYQKLSGPALEKDLNYSFMLITYYEGINQLVKAIPLLLKAKKQFEKGGNIGALQQINDYLAGAYAGMHDYKSAHGYLKEAYKLKDSLEKLAAKEDVSLMEMQKQQELQTTAYNEEKKLQEAEQSKILFRNRVRLYSLLAGVLILILIAGLLWRNSLQKQKANKVLQHTLADLRTTQAQLVQSEKMASLGELTAGVAHEIQNPLNFVNNFSELNKELVDELQQELKAGNTDQAIAISNDLKSNEEKINHHGKRADAIVKGMLQHSRSHSGQKELADINALADEYFRLAYHGLRAKDKSFNATMRTDFDERVGKVYVIPQDIGRVILNLITNAFYAVDEKKKSGVEHFEPAVSVITKKTSDKVLISVKDNGNGIPQKVLDKIFQPFFTTKPTGHGTGLGLSLAYDIVKAHGGELKVETKEGEGAEFCIQLPAGGQ